MSNNIWGNQSPFTDTRGGPNGGGGGGITYRSAIDAARAGGDNRQGPAEYPDGYLGDSRIRQEDKLARNVDDKMRDRAYQRGVHRGGKQPPEVYQWPADFGPDTRLEAESYPGWDGDCMTVPRSVPVGEPETFLRHGGSQANLTDAARQQVYQRLGIQSTIPSGQMINLPPEVAKEWLPPWS